MEAKIRETAKYSTMLEKSHPMNRSASRPNTRYAILLYRFGNIILKQLKLRLINELIQYDWIGFRKSETKLLPADFE
jgi:hypothetical protein